MLNKTQLLPDRPGIPPMAKLPEPEVIDPSALAKSYAQWSMYSLICAMSAQRRRSRTGSCWPQLPQ